MPPAAWESVVLSLRPRHSSQGAAAPSDVKQRRLPTVLGPSTIPSTQCVISWLRIEGKRLIDRMVSAAERKMFV